MTQLVFLGLDETTPEFSVKATSPFSVQIDFAPRRVAVGPSAPARKTYHFEATGHESVERAFSEIEKARLASVVTEKSILDNNDPDACLGIAQASFARAAENIKRGAK